jgi:hypothetical protein
MTLVLAMAQESAEVSKSVQDARQKITSMEEHISKGQSLWLTSSVILCFEIFLIRLLSDLRTR